MATIEYQQLRSAGASITSKERELARIQEKISFVEAQRQRRQSEGKRDAETYRMDELQSLRQRYSSASQEYQNLREGLGESGYGAAIAAAPKRYRESRFSERAYDPGGEGPGKSESRSYFQAKELASKQPGIYQYKTGGAFISTSGDGSFVNQQGEYIEVRSPIGQRNDGSFIYKPKNVPSEKTVTGIDLFNPSNRDAIKSSSTQFGSAGLLFGSASPSVPASFMPSSQQNAFNPATASFGSFIKQELRQQSFGSRYNTAKEYLLQTQNPGIGLFTGIARGTRSAGSLVERTGLFLESKSQNNTAALYGSQLVTGLGASARKDPFVFGAETSASLFVGYGVGSLYGSASKRVAGSVIKTRLLKGGAFAIGATGLAYDVGTSSPKELGGKIPSYVAFGSGFNYGYRGQVPKVEFLGITDQRSIGASESRFSKYQFTGERSSLFNAELKVNGARQSVPFRVETIVSGQRYPGGTKFFSTPEGVVTGKIKPSSVYSVEAIQSGTFRFGEKDYFLSSETFKGAYRAKGGLLVGKTGDTIFASERLGTRRGREIGQFAELSGSKFPGVRRTGLEFRTPETFRYAKTRFSIDKIDTSFGSIDTAGFSYRQNKLFSRSGIASRSQNAGGAPSDFMNRAFSFGERTGVLSANRIEPKPYRSSLSERASKTMFPSRFKRLYSGVPMIESSFVEPVGKSRAGGYGRFTSGSKVLDPFVDRLPFIPESATSFNSRSGFSFGRLPSSSFGSVSLLNSGLLSSSLVSSSSTTKSLPITGNNIIVRSASSYDSVLSSRVSLLSSFGPSQFSPVVPSIPESPSKQEFPGLPGFGVPLFGPPSGGSSGGRGRGRAFKYAPSLNALIFNIKGRKENKRLTGFETRPILQQR